MKQLLILSGKGGTGKTTVASAFIRLGSAGAYADCDVDAPNLHLVMGQSAKPISRDYYGMDKAGIDTKRCTACLACVQNCRFGAVSRLEDGTVKVDPYACEGCGVCVAVCFAAAVSLQPSTAGQLQLYADGGPVFSTAQLKMGGGTSGKLVTEVKKQMLSAVSPEAALAVIDGSPGIGCPVIASLSGVDMVLIVTEPTVSGLSDLERIVRTAEIFHVQAAVCINKYDVSPRNAEKIGIFCRAKGLPFVGLIPFDPEAVRAVNSGRTIADTDSPAGRAVREVFRRVMELLYEKGGDEL